MIKLLLRFDTESRELELADASITIGRSSENQIALSDKKTSRKHARIEKTDQGYRLSDLGSGNGTRVNGREVDSVLLSKGDEVKIGLTTLYVLDFDGPVPAAAPAPAAVPVAAVVAPPPPAPVKAEAPAPAPAPAPVAEKPVEASRPKITRRATYTPKSGAGGKIVAAALTLIILGSAAYAAYVYLPQMSLSTQKPVSSTKEKVDPAAKERADALAAIRAKVTGATVMTEELVREANDLSAKNASAEPQFEAVAAQARLKWAEQLGKMTFEQVEQLVAVSLRERRYGDAIDALKPLKNGADSARVAALMTKVDAETKSEFGAVDKFGKDLVGREQYTLAIEHYRTNAPKFRGTQYFKTLSNNAESLEELAKMKQEVASRPKPEQEVAKVTPKPEPEPEKPKPEPEKPKEEPKPAMPVETKKPAMEAPKPAPKPAEKPKEPEKPKPEPEKPKPAPEKPKEAEKPKEPVTAKAFKKPDVLCNCKKVVKGVYCIKCDRTLEPDDLRKNLCKRCEEPPKKVDICVKKYYTVDGHPEKVSDKPITFEGKVYDIPQEDRARILYFCTTCEDVADVQGEMKHKPDCSNKNTVIKVCTKSGIGPHQPDNK